MNDQNTNHEDDNSAWLDRKQGGVGEDEGGEEILHEGDRGGRHHSTWVKTNKLCGNCLCAIQGILNQGYRKSFIKRGASHFFTPAPRVSKGYALFKVNSFPRFQHEILLPIIVCKVRNVKQARFRYVEHDDEVL
ncbi:hypothetical protein BGX29_000483 [Mortierella sp. GBA35]|nr:hypothetical protein BGX29_000483 [Mortierella sp. GBA35]